LAGSSLPRPLRFGCPLRSGGSCDRLFCRHSSSLGPPFGKDLLSEETSRLLDVACATGTFHQWKCRMTGFAVAFCCSPQSRCPCRLSLTCDNIRQLFQTQDERSTVMCSRSSLYLSGYRLSPVWACSIYLFHHHIISFWRSHFTPVTAILGAAIRNESNLSRNAAKRMPIKKSIRGSIQTEGEDELQGRRRSATPGRLHRGRNRAVESTP
jgi:hypothetical protein